MNCTVENIKSYGHDGFLGGLHSLLGMDDTVLFATGRQPVCDKLDLLWPSTKPINMGIHPTKSLYTPVNVNDQEPFIGGDSKISYTKEYIYVGSPISSATITHQVESHIKSKQTFSI